MVNSSWFEQFFMKSCVTLRWCSDGLDKQVVLGVTPLCLLLLIRGCCTVTVQGTFIFWQVLKACLRGRKHLAVLAPLVAFQSSALPWQKKLILKSLQPCSHPGFLRCALPRGVFASLWIMTDWEFAAVIVSRREEPWEFRQLEGAASSSVWFGVCFAFPTQLGKEDKNTQKFCQCVVCMCLRIWTSPEWGSSLQMKYFA